MVTQYVAVYGDPVEGNPTSIMQNAAFEHAGLDEADALVHAHLIAVR